MENRTPTILDIIKKSAENERLDIHTSLPCRVVSFNQNDNTVTLEPMIKQGLSNGEYADLPVLVDVPVQFPRAGGFAFTVPVAAGDEGVALFSERCIDGWFDTGAKSKPLDARLHDYSDAFFIPGISSRPRAIPSVFMDGASMQTLDGSTYIRLTDGKILIKGDIEHIGNSEQTGDSKQLGNHEQAGNFNQTSGNSKSAGTISADKVIVNGIDLETHTHPVNQNQTGEPNK